MRDTSEGRNAKARMNKYGFAYSIAGAPPVNIRKQEGRKEEKYLTVLKTPSGLINKIGVLTMAIRNPTTTA
eukprot:scaffold12003_cov44-Attheya_sp.AAC.1